MTDPVQSEAQQAEDVAIGVRSIRAIHRIHPNLMLIHNPTYSYLVGQLREPALRPLRQALQPDGLAVTDMVKYLPHDATERDWFKWYNLPYDQHWSDAGAQVYGHAVYLAVRERLMPVNQSHGTITEAQPAK